MIPKEKEATPPGKVLINRLTLHAKYLISGISGVLIFCIGLLTLFWASFLKYENEPFVRWFLAGIFAFCCITVGVWLVSLANRYQMTLEMRKFVRKEIRKNVNKMKKPEKKAQVDKA
jgi:hypothetical protein